MPIRFSEFSSQEMGSPFLGLMAHAEAGRSLCVRSRLLSVRVAQKSKVVCQLARRVAQPSIARGNTCENEVIWNRIDFGSWLMSGHLLVVWFHCF